VTNSNEQRHYKLSFEPWESWCACDSEFLRSIVRPVFP
jgi:hypothetical protein